MTRMISAFILALVFLLSACQDAQPVEVTLEGVPRTGKEPMLF